MSNPSAVSTHPLTEDDWPEVLAVDVRAFGGTLADQDPDLTWAALDTDRFRIARDDRTGDVVGVAGAFTLELTLPGNAVLPMGGLTWVSVAPTHRRRGILRRLIGEVHDDSVSRGEPLMGLWASESGIYERFGYGVATSVVDVEIARAGLTFREPASDDLGTVRLVDATTITDELAELWDRYRRTAPGEVTRSRAIYELANASAKDVHAAFHDDGYAIWSMKGEWSAGGVPDSTLQLRGFAAATPAAHEALWRTIASVDLVSTIKAGLAFRANDPLRWLLTDPRQVRTTSRYDGVWLRLADPVRCFDARSYRTDDGLVVQTEGVDGGELVTFEVGPDGARPTDASPDLTLTASAAGSLLLGGVSASELAAGGRASGSPEILGRADALFGWDPEPVCGAMF